MNKGKIISFSKKFRDSIICPINKTIFLDPVLAYDGIIYERQIIEHWLQKNNFSPTTGKILSTKELVPVLPLKNIINNFLELCPNLRSEQYSITLQKHMEYTYIVHDIIIQKNFDKLEKFGEFSLAIIGNLLEGLILEGPINITKYVIDNALDLNAMDQYGKSLIHYVVQYGSLEILKYLVSKNVNLEATIRDTEIKPIHIICQYGKNDTIAYFTDLNISLEPINKFGIRPIHLLCDNNNINDDTIIKFINKGINLECVDSKGIKPIHIACDCSGHREKLILFLLNKNIDLNCADNSGWKPIHYLCSGSNIRTIKEIIDKNVDVNCADNYGKKPIHMLAKPSTITMLQYLISKGASISDYHQDNDEIMNDNDSDEYDFNNSIY
jgi:ankyrin repeat protein